MGNQSPSDEPLRHGPGEREIQREAQRRAAELDAAINSITNGVMIFGPDGKLNRMNPMAEFLFGHRLQEGELSVDSAADRLGMYRLDGAALSAEEVPIHRAFRGETVINEVLEVRYRRSPHRRCLAFSAAPMRDSQGNLLGVVATFADITHQRELERQREELLRQVQAQAEGMRQINEHLESRVRKRTEELYAAYEAVRESEEKYRQLIEDANSIILRLDTTGRITFINPFAQAFFGYTEEELLGREAVATILPEVDSSGRDTQAMVRDVIDHPERYETYENENIRRNGERVWVSWTNRAIYDREGNPAGLLSIGNDITGRKHAEVALARANRALRTLTECDQAMVHVCEELQLIEEVWRILIQTGGYRVAWVGYHEGGHIRLKASGDASLSATSGLPRAESQGEWATALEAIRTGKSTLHRSSCDALPSWGENAVDGDAPAEIALPLIMEGKVFGTLVIGASEPDAFDTEEVELLGNLANNLSYGIAAIRTRQERQRAERALQVHMEKLERSNQDLQDFAFVASHDLQEPLRKVQSFGNLLTVKYKKQLGTDGQDYIQRMQSAATRMQTLINDLLNYSRVTTRAAPFQEIDLNRLVREVLMDLETRITQTGGRVAVAPLPTLEADPNQMRQLFQNLIGNALKFHGEEPPVVEVTGATSTNGTVEIRVQDNGIGFDEKYLDRIFAPFQRLHGRSTYEGTGIGLAICRKIVERHGGTITARSTPGSGATFMITLPLRQAG